MNRFRCLVWSVPTVLLFLLSQPASAAEGGLRDGDRVLFLGDTFFEREVDYGHLETHITAAYRDQDLTFRNLGWAADSPMGRSRASFDWNKSPSDWLKRVQEQIGDFKPTVAVLAHGMTEALELAALPSGAAQSTHLSGFLAQTRQLMGAVRERGGADVRFILVGPLDLGAIPSDLPPQDRKPIETLATQIPRVREALRGLASETGSQSIGLESTAALPREADLVHLNESGYRALADAIVNRSGGAVEGGSPAYLVLNAAVRKKNELFFHRWRPANWTYLFGFRKYEQGQNAVEIPKFDPLIREWEGRIAKLRDLDHQDPAVVAEVTRLQKEAAERAHRDPKFKVQPEPTFDIAPGFSVSLWAENPMLYKPIQMNWDPKGRLWVASSRLYPQIKPGQDAEDAVIVLEDTDGDGKADRHTVFADGLVIPTGVVPDGRGGCYVAASHQLLHIADTDGDGRGDRQTIVMSSFGTEDTHHNLHTLRWGYDGHLYLNQSIYTHSHIETPQGVRRLNSAGIWRFNPDTSRLGIFTRGGCNPWGHHWDQFGNSFFTDGAGGKGIYHAMEGGTYFTYSDMRREGDSISPGSYPKFASLEIVHSPQFPADWQGNAITCDFRAHRVVRFGVNDNGSTFQTRELPDLLRSTNVTFRPIDLRLGPDGALYIADWSNPIIQHGEVDFRDPRRDHEHGRIWRVAHTGGKSAPAGIAVRDLTRLSTPELLTLTLSRNGWDQEQARVVLRQRGAAEVLPAVQTWVTQQKDPRAPLEAMWLGEAFGQPSTELVGTLAAAADERLRTAAARQLSR